MQVETGMTMGQGVTKTRRRTTAGPGVSAGEGPVIAPLVARRLDVLLRDQGSDAGKLARQSGIDRVVLDRILSGQIEPTVDLLWKIANALGVRFSALLPPGPTPDFTLFRASETRRFTSRDGGFQSRVLSPSTAGAPVEFYGITLAPGSQQRFDAHAPRTAENLTVHSGAIELVIGREPARRLETGDSIYFLADVPHSYRNLGEEPAHLYLVMTYWGLPGD